MCLCWPGAPTPRERCHRFQPLRTLGTAASALVAWAPVSPDPATSLQAEFIDSLIALSPPNQNDYLRLID